MRTTKARKATTTDDASPCSESVKDSAREGHIFAKPRSPKSWRTVAQFSHQEEVGMTTTYAELKSGRLKGVKVGRITRITDEAADAWKAALPAYEPGGDAFNKRG